MEKPVIFWDFGIERLEKLFDQLVLFEKREASLDEVKRVRIRIMKVKYAKTRETDMLLKRIEFMVGDGTSLRKYHRLAIYNFFASLNPLYLVDFFDMANEEVLVRMLVAFSDSEVRGMLSAFEDEGLTFDVENKAIQEMLEFFLDVSPRLFS